MVARGCTAAQTRMSQGRLRDPPARRWKSSPAGCRPRLRRTGELPDAASLARMRTLVEAGALRPRRMGRSPGCTSPAHDALRPPRCWPLAEPLGSRTPCRPSAAEQRASGTCPKLKQARKPFRIARLRSRPHSLSTGLTTPAGDKPRSRAVAASDADRPPAESEPAPQHPVADPQAEQRDHHPGRDRNADDGEHHQKATPPATAA